MAGAGNALVGAVKRDMHSVPLLGVFSAQCCQRISADSMAAQSLTRFIAYRHLRQQTDSRERHAKSCRDRFDEGAG